MPIGSIKISASIALAFVVASGTVQAQSGAFFAAPLVGPNDFATASPTSVRNPEERRLPAYPILPTIDVAAAPARSVEPDLFPLGPTVSAFGVPVRDTGQPVFLAQPTPLRPNELRVVRYTYDPTNPAAPIQPRWSEPLALP